MSRRRAGTPITRAELGALRCRVAKRIYEALQRKGGTAGLVADELGISESAVCATVRGTTIRSAFWMRSVRRASRKNTFLTPAGWLR